MRQTPPYKLTMPRNSLLLTVCLFLLPALGCGSGDKEKKAATAADAKDSKDSKADASDKKINLNTATEDEFKAIPNVGEKMAHEFEEYRPYASIEQFRKRMSNYVDADTIAEYEKHVFVPIAFNDCDAATLQQIPGIDAEGAEAIIGGRPYDDDVAFLTKVKELSGEAAEAAAMDMVASGG